MANHTVKGFHASGRKHTGIALQKREEKFRLLFEKSADPLLLLDGDILMDCNETALELLRVPSKDQVIGLRPFDMCPERQPDGRLSSEKAREMIGTALEKGVNRFEWVYRDFHEKDLWMEVSLTVVPIHGTEIIYAIWRDITDRKRAEEALRTSRLQLSEAMDLASIVYWERDPATGDFIFDDPFYAFYGTCAEGEGGYRMAGEEYVKRFVHPDDIPLFRHATEKRSMDRSREFVSDFGHRIIRRDGQVRHILARVRATRDDTGRISRWYGANQDITERKRHEEALRASEARLHAVLDQMPLGIAIREAPSLKIILVNEQAEQISGAPLSAGLEDFGREEGFHPDGRRYRPEEWPIVRAAIGGETVQGEEIECRVADGSFVFIRVNAAPIYNDAGRIIAAVSVFEDITGQKKSAGEREALLKSVEKERSRLRSVLDSLPVAVGIADCDGRLIEVNQPASHLWHGDPPLIGSVPDYDKQTAWFADTGKRIEPHEWTLPRVMATGRPVIGEMVDIERLDGTRGTILQSAAPMNDAEGHMIGMVSVTQDITERRQMEEKQRTLERQLREAQKMESVGTLAGGIAHDFNNILAAIIGFSEIAAEKLPSDSQAQRYLKRVIDAGIRGRDLVRQILTFSRRSEQEKKATHLGPIVAETAKLLRASLPSTISIALNLERESGFVLADAAQMQQVIMNLCTNAAYAMRQTGGKISIDVGDFSFSDQKDAPDPAMSPGSYTRLLVTDTGKGIPPEIVGRIFDPFFTTKPTGVGTGLGLAVVHGVITTHQGLITVASEQGRGSTFAVYLPKYFGARARASEDGDSVAAGRGERLLFVDDEEALTEIGRRMLTGVGYQVVSKTSSREALALFRLDPSQFDLVITDMTMPELTGIDLAKEMLALRADIPVILCTGFSHAVDAGAARQAGIRAFVMKPATKKELTRTIRDVLGG